MGRIAIACGGTGGHLFPGLAVAQECVRRGHEVRLYISPKTIDRQMLQAYPEFKAVALPTVGWTGLNLKAASFFRKAWEGYGLCLDEIADFQPHVILGMGGFTSAPLIFAARRRKIPSFLHESNAIPGKVTKWLAPRVSKVLLGFSQCAKYLAPAICAHTGTPVRPSLITKERAHAAEHFGLNPGLPTVAIIGGSQGAQGLNEMIIRAMPGWQKLAGKVQFIHLTGPRDDQLMMANYRRYHLVAVALPFCAEMENVYSLADLVVARSGASSLAELCYYALPSILVPYPEAAENHQLRNAEIFVEAGAALLMPQGNDSVEKLTDAVADLILDEPLRKEMSRRAEELVQVDATARITEELEYAMRP